MSARLAGEGGGSVAGGVSSGTPRARVLVADDDPDIGRILRMLLRRLGCDVEVVGDGEAAVASVKRAAPEILFCDYMMPRMGGRETIAWVKANAPSVHVYIITAQGADEVIRECLDAGADGYIEKPFDYAAIASACDRALGKPGDPPAQGPAPG